MRRNGLYVVKQMPTPTEAEEMGVLSAYLDWLDVLWVHPASEGKRSWAAGSYAKAHGLLRKGYPDIIICTQPPRLAHRGVMIELKRKTPRGRVTPEQMAFLERARNEGWAAEVCFGAEDAIAFLHVCGWERPWPTKR